MPPAQSKTDMHYFLLLTGMAGLLALYVFLVRKGDRVVFHPIRTALPTHIPFEYFFLPLSSSKKIHAAWLPPQKDKEVLLFFHGNGGTISHFEAFARQYHAYGYGILMFDYRGFGQSAGRASEPHAKQDSCAALNYLLTHKKISPQNIVLWGYSLGNVFALHIAAKYNYLPFKAVILQSPFTNAAQMGAWRISPTQRGLKYWAVWAFLKVIFLRHSYDNAPRINQVKAPLLVAYSRQDQSVPWQMSRRLFLLAPQGTQEFISPVGTHEQFAWLHMAALAFLSKVKTAGLTVR